MNHLTHDPQFLKNDKRLLPPGGSTFNQTNDQAAQLYPHEFTLSIKLIYCLKFSFYSSRLLLTKGIPSAVIQRLWSVLKDVTLNGNDDMMI